MSRTLGLDMGPNSIGWALIEESSEPGQSKIIDLGVRVFPEGVDAFDTAKEKSKNEDRRTRRAARRQTNRRARRELLLKNSLIAKGLWPANPQSQEEELSKNPYPLRARALLDRLSPFEIGRVLLHLSRRRGFLSNRKRDATDKETSEMLEEINRNEQERIAGGYPTVGAMLAAKYAQLNHRDRSKNDHVRNRHLSRQQLFDEFQAIWESQRKFHPELLTDKLKFGAFGPVMTHNPVSNQLELSLAPRRPIGRKDARRRGLSDVDAFGLFGILFFQRPLYWPKSVVGLCELEPNQKRCPKSDRAAERFRALQELNNLRRMVNGVESPLDPKERARVLALLARKEKLTFDDIRKALRLQESVRFNLERGERSSIKGMVVDCKIAKAIGKNWHERTEEEKTSIVRLLLNDDVDDNHKVERLRDKHSLTLEQAQRAVAVDLPPGYVRLSRRAIEKLLPHLERGLVYQSASDPKRSALHAAGYLRRDELQRRLFDQLPDFSRLKPADCKLGNIPNPVVRRALVELRKVVNAIIREYGKPDAVHVELARNVQVGAEKRKEMSKKMRNRERQREAAAEEVRQRGFAVRRDAILRYLLWQEQKNDCVYCGKTISQAQLFAGDVDVDHILPYSRCLDDSQLNKVVVHRECNRDKGQRTPYEWLAASRPADYDRIVQKATQLLRDKAIPYSKYRRFVQKELDLDQFIARQLTDTAYITRATVEYLQLLFDRPTAVLGLKGQLTAELRWHWGLDTVLSETTNSPAWREPNSNAFTRGAKNRADHRHHAIDALVVALTNCRRLRRLSEIVRRGGATSEADILETPWEDFRSDVLRRIERVNVSHRVQRKVSGQLHEETQYGPTKTPGEWAVRKPVIDLSANEVGLIRDETIRNLVNETLREAGCMSGRGQKWDKTRVKEALSDLRMPSGVPIRKVRIQKPDLTVRPIRKPNSRKAYVKPGNTHHLSIFEFEERGKIKREAVFTTMLEAVERLKNRQPVIRRVHPERPEARFLFSLSSRELVQVENDGTQRILVFKTAASTQGQIYFAHQYDARRSTEQEKVVFSANTLSGRKVTVDAIGRVRWAND